MATQEMWNRSVLASLKSAVATLVVIFFFTVFNIDVPLAIVPLSIVAVFLLCCLLYYRELFYFFAKNPTVFIYPLIAVISATWSIAPSKTVWYAFQLCITVGGAIFMGITATPRQLVRGIFVAMAIVIIASVISGRMGPSAVGPVLIGITGGKTAIGLVAVTLFGSGMAILFDLQHPPIYRLATLALIPLGAYIATHVEAATALVSVFAFPIAFFGFLSLRYVGPMGRSAVVALLLVLIPVSVLTYAGVPDVNQRILRALNKDATLTGRTMMWVKADAWIEKSPEIGYGFRAFWTSESADSMGILHSFKLTDGRVFQLHNTIEEMRVDTGWLGLLAFLSTVMVFLCYIVAFVFLYPSASSAFIATMYLIILAHSPIQVLIGVFYPTTAFFYVCGTVAIVFFMNRQQTTRGQARTAPHGGGHFAWQGRIGRPALAPNRSQSI